MPLLASSYRKLATNAVMESIETLSYQVIIGELASLRRR
jgi:hypothetical protein